MFAILLIGNLPALLTWLFLKYCSVGVDGVNSVGGSSDTLAGTAGGFAFSMLGLLVGVVSLFGFQGHSRALNTYRQSGYLEVYFWVLSATMVELTLAFFASLQMLFSGATDSEIRCVLVSLVGSSVMVAGCIYPVVRLQIRAAAEPITQDDIAKDNRCKFVE